MTPKQKNDQRIVDYLQQGIIDCDDIGNIFLLKQRIRDDDGEWVDSPCRRLIKQDASNNAYRRFHIRRDGIESTFRVHRVVLIKYVGLPVGNADQTHHKNSNRADNRLSNLKWVTHSANMIGRERRYLNLTQLEIDTLRARVKAGESKNSLAQEMGCTWQTLDARLKPRKNKRGKKQHGKSVYVGDLSLKAYCRDHKLSYGCVQHWRNRSGLSTEDAIAKAIAFAKKEK